MMNSHFRPMIARLSAAAAAAAAAVALLAAPAGAVAQELKIGYVNSDRMLRDAAPAKAAQAKLETEFGRREKELNDAAARLKVAADKFEKDQVTLAEAERARRQRDLVDQDRELQRKRREFQEDLNARKQEELQQIIDRANRIVRQLAETEKYDAVFQEAVYINPRLDITDKVIKALNGGK